MFWDINVYKDVSDFLFFGHKNVSYFLEFHLKLNFFFFFFLFLLPFLFLNFGAPFHLGDLGNDLISLVERAGPVCKKPCNSNNTSNLQEVPKHCPNPLKWDGTRHIS